MRYSVPIVAPELSIFEYSTLYVTFIVSPLGNNLMRPVAPERSVLLSMSMVQSNPSYREPHSHPLPRLLAAAALVAFLLAQPWVVCAPLCLLHGHAKVASAASQYQDRIIHCHSDNVVVSQPTAQSLGNMLPARVAPPLLSARIVAIRFAPPAPIHLQQIPPADPPPPRPV
jgi:hypothetical protein